jgi:hypothetical protein
MGRHADLQKLVNTANTSERADHSLVSEGDEADASSDLMLLLVAGVGFEPT